MVKAQAKSNEGKRFRFEGLGDSDLMIDALYESGNAGTAGDDPISKILNVGNSGGFRWAGTTDNLKYLVLYTTGEDLDWPDSIDVETGVFRYYGDNKTPGHDLHDTKKGGNRILRDLFNNLHLQGRRDRIPPIFIFEKYPAPNNRNRSVKFRGLCVPGIKKTDSQKDLVAVWKTSEGYRFQNYEAYFTILDINRVERAWIEDLDKGCENTENAPTAFIKWKKTGEWKPLTAPKAIEIRSPVEQLPDKSEHKKMLERIYDRFKKDSSGFEYFAAAVYEGMSNESKQITITEVTRPTSDGGRDAYGYLNIGIEEDPVKLYFSLEAKCYNPGINNQKKRTSVGVRDMSRLISRIRNREFGVLVTTSAVGKQAYDEVRKDGHPIIILSGKDIVNQLVRNSINDESSLESFISKVVPSKKNVEKNKN